MTLCLFCGCVFDGYYLQLLVYFICPNVTAIGKSRLLRPVNSALVKSSILRGPLGYVYKRPVPKGSKRTRSKNRIRKAFCLHGTVLEPVRNESERIQNWACFFYRSNFGSIWICSGPVPERSCVNRC